MDRLSSRVDPMLALSCRGTRQFILAVNEVARRRGVATGDMVREIVEKSLGDELTEPLSFFAGSGENNHRVERKVKGSNAKRVKATPVLES